MAIIQARFPVNLKIRVLKVKPLLFNTELLIKIDHPAILRQHLTFQHEPFKMRVVYMVVVHHLHLFHHRDWDISLLFLHKSLTKTEKRLTIQVLPQTINLLNILKMEITRCNSYRRNRIMFLTLV